MRVKDLATTELPTEPGTYIVWENDTTPFEFLAEIYEFSNTLGDPILMVKIEMDVSTLEKPLSQLTGVAAWLRVK